MREILVDESADRNGQALKLLVASVSVGLTVSA